MDKSRRVFVHVSDIHFHHRWHGNNLDRDAELRQGLLRDAADIVARLGRCDGILVSGDIAFGGEAAQYELAVGWLGDLCKATGCGPEEVWCVPGNHDVQRAQGGSIRDGLIQTLRAADPKNVCEDVIRYLRDPAGEDVWLRCLKDYCDFARRFGCQVSAKQLWWEDSSIRLNDGSRLCIRGVTSALASNADDHLETGKMVLGDIQLHHDRSADSVRLVLCHHPPDWLRDYEQVESALKAYAEIQLYGHKHALAVRNVDGRLRVHAGALQPSRTESDWCPRFNVLELAVRRAEGERWLDITVHSRIWDIGERSFKIDSAPGDQREHRQSIRLPAWEPPDFASNNLSMSELPEQSPSPQPEQVARTGHNPHKVLTYRFFDLSYTVRLQIAQELGLISDSDEHLTERERMRQVFERARASKKLAALWQTVRQRSGATDMDGDPFAGH